MGVRVTAIIKKSVKRSEVIESKSKRFNSGIIEPSAIPDSKARHPPTQPASVLPATAGRANAKSAHQALPPRMVA